MPGETISLVARVARGTAAMHAKWSPVAVVEYKIVPAIAIDNSKFQSVEDLEDVVYSCPKDIFEIDGDTLVAARPADCTMCKECLKNAPPGALTIDPMGGAPLSSAVDIRMAIEPIGQLSVDACVAQAFSIIEDKLHCIAEYLDSVATGEIDIVEISKVYK
jgi:NAD-dependent dihydropyrimidine dehydrogenase PreA subunit